MAANLGRQKARDTALDFLHAGTAIQRGTTIALPAAMESTERREKAGLERTIYRHRVERETLKQAPSLQEMAQRTREAAWQQACQIQQRVQDHIRHYQERGPSLRM